MAGLVTTVRGIRTKKGKPMGFATLEDIQGTVELVVFPKTWEKYHELLKTDTVICAEGNWTHKAATPRCWWINSPVCSRMSSGMNPFLRLPRLPRQAGAEQRSGRIWRTRRRRTPHSRPIGRSRRCKPYHSPSRPWRWQMVIPVEAPTGSREKLAAVLEKIAEPAPEPLVDAQNDGCRCTCHPTGDRSHPVS